MSQAHGWFYFHDRVSRGGKLAPALPAAATDRSKPPPRTSSTGASATSFDYVAARQPYSVDLTGADEPEVLYGWMVTEGFFEALAVSAAHGRTFPARRVTPGSGVVVLTDGL